MFQQAWATAYFDMEKLYAAFTVMEEKAFFDIQKRRKLSDNQFVLFVDAFSYIGFLLNVSVKYDILNSTSNMDRIGLRTLLNNCKWGRENQHIRTFIEVIEINDDDE